MRMCVLTAALLVAGSTAVLGQVQPPPVADNADLRDRNIKDRSIDLERVKRDENKANTPGKAGDVIGENKFNEIKEDFEQIQIQQSTIVSAYQKAGKIDYRLISTGAEQISKRGTRLRNNLFPVPKQEDSKKKDKKKKGEDKKIEDPVTETRSIPDDVKSLIADIDNTLAIFVANAMFSNTRVVNASDHEKAKADLEYIVALSNRLYEVSTTHIGTSN